MGSGQKHTLLVSIATTMVLVFLLSVLGGCATTPRTEIIRVKGYGTAKDIAPPSVPRPEVSEPLQLDWAKERITAVGNGAPPETAVNEAQARLMARRAAQLDALRNLAEKIKGIHITSRTLVRDFITESDEIQSRVEAIIKGAKIIEEKERDDGSWQVTVSLDMAPLAELVSESFKERRQAPPPDSQRIIPPGQARLMARRAAQLDAYRNLLELVKGIQLKSGTTVEDFMLKDDKIKSRVEGLVRQARIVDVQYLEDGTCEVTLEFDISRIRQNIR